MLVPQNYRMQCLLTKWVEIVNSILLSRFYSLFLQHNKNIEIVDLQQCIMILKPRPRLLSFVCPLFGCPASPLTSRASVFAHGNAHQLRFCAPYSQTHGRARSIAAHRCLRTGRGLYRKTQLEHRRFLFEFFYKPPFVISSLWEIFRFVSIARWKRCLDLFLLTQLSYLRPTASWNPCWRTRRNCPFTTLRVSAESRFCWRRV